MGVTLLRGFLLNVTFKYLHSEIKLAATDNYLVSISQEERLDRPSYRAKVEPCTITILKREISARLPWQKR